MTDGIRIVPGTSLVHPLVYSSWLRSAAPKRATVSYWAAEHERIERLLRRCDLRVAEHEDAPGVALGWALVDLAIGAVHYAYVRRPYRRMGVGAALVADMPDDTIYTTRPRRRDLRRAIPMGWRFDEWSGR